MEVKKKISLIDTNFSGRNIIDIPGVNFSWYTGDAITSNHVFFTDKHLQYVDDDIYNDSKKVAWLLEPIGIDPGIYTWILENYHKFDNVLTFDGDIISQIDNGLSAIWYILGRERQPGKE